MFSARDTSGYSWPSPLCISSIIWYLLLMASCHMESSTTGNHLRVSSLPFFQISWPVWCFTLWTGAPDKNLRWQVRMVNLFTRSIPCSSAKSSPKKSMTLLKATNSANSRQATPPSADQTRSSTKTSWPCQIQTRKKHPCRVKMTFRGIIAQACCLTKRLI